MSEDLYFEPLPDVSEEDLVTRDGDVIIPRHPGDSETYVPEDQISLATASELVRSEAFGELCESQLKMAEDLLKTLFSFLERRDMEQARDTWMMISTLIVTTCSAWNRAGVPKRVRARLTLEDVALEDE